MKFVDRLERAKRLIETRVEPQVLATMKSVITDFVREESKRVIVELLEDSKSLVHVYPVWNDPSFECRGELETKGEKISFSDPELSDIYTKRVINGMIQKHVMEACDEAMIAEFDGTRIVNYMTLYQGDDIASIHYKISLRDFDAGYDGIARVLQ